MKRQEEEVRGQRQRSTKETGILTNGGTEAGYGNAREKREGGSGGDRRADRQADTGSEAVSYWYLTPSQPVGLR